MISLLLLLLAVGFIVWSTTRWRLHPFLALLLAALGYGLAAGMSSEKLIASVNEGFGGTMGSIGLVIVLGVIIGAFLEHSGGAFRLAERMLGWVGRRRVPEGMALMGYVVSVPVFCDSGFILLTPLNKALTKRAGLSLGVTAVALALGLLASHAMVPPTPGPIATAGIIGADLGLVILLGLGVSLAALLPAMWFARRFASRVFIDPSPELSEGEIAAKTAAAPAAGKAFLPIGVPILLIVLKSLNDYLGWVEDAPLKGAIDFLGTPFVALLAGLGFALLLPRKLDREMVSAQGWVGKALRDAAGILLITGAGGIFGKVLQHSGLGDVLGSALVGLHLGIWLPFLIAAALKTAQGSSTVAMITTASLIAPLTAQLGLDGDFAKALAVLAIGAGSTVVSHANDSYFWVVTQFSGMDVRTGYRLHSLGTAVLGLSAGLLLFLLAMFL